MPIENPAEREPERAEAGERPYRLPVPSQQILEHLLHKHAGVILHIAEELSCSRRQVHRWLDRYGLHVESFRKPDSHEQ
jgi:DNA-binding NtrC family response regulator